MCQSQYCAFDGKGVRTLGIWSCHWMKTTVVRPKGSEASENLKKEVLWTQFMADEVQDPFLPSFSHPPFRKPCITIFLITRQNSSWWFVVTFQILVLIFLGWRWCGEISFDYPGIFPFFRLFSYRLVVHFTRVRFIVQPDHWRNLQETSWSRQQPIHAGNRGYVFKSPFKFLRSHPFSRHRWYRTVFSNEGKFLEWREFSN